MIMKGLKAKVTNNFKLINCIIIKIILIFDYIYFQLYLCLSIIYPFNKKKHSKHSFIFKKNFLFLIKFLFYFFLKLQY